MKDRFLNRRLIIGAIVVLAALFLLIRLFSIQVVDTSYRVSADNNVLRYVTQYPARGLIYDRNGKLMVYNQAAYDVMVIPVQVSLKDTAGFCQSLGITRSYFLERMKAAISYSRRAPSVFLKQISAETYAAFQEKMFMYPGFYVQPRTLRKYSKPVASHALGYVSEVDENIIRKKPYYKSGDYIGTTGIEEAYEEELRGRKGVRIFLVDVYGRVKGSYEEGKFDTTAVQGKDIISTLDLDLQEYAETLMKGKSGSVVAIQPSTGEILTLVSSPWYDPGLLVGRIRSENFAKLQADTAKPIFNRATMASYPPGSTFKPVNGLIALQEKVITPSTMFGCDPGYLFVGCHVHETPLDLAGAVKNSCNSYFCQAFRRIMENPSYKSVTEAYNKWREYLDQFGFGRPLGSDLVNERPGFLPAASFYDNRYGQGRWKALTIISMAIGQGEVGASPLQMANMTAAIANRGYYYSPHIVRAIGDSLNKTRGLSVRHEIKIDPENFESIIKGMDAAVNGGAGATASIAAIDSITVCGKTGTAQNPHGKDHSIFIAFAPKEKPEIAIAVYIENAGFGATYAAPVASLIIEKYLRGTIKRKYLEDYVFSLTL
ncbi:MAG TPA: penicillin-binding protein 2 [Bacteroidales bacterium]|nr:penicillin-binding protein 2 [Bacteroidales bacterium]HRR93124.1 penicillin-binding protein 2 [Bacteroidales bacterium]